MNLDDLDWSFELPDFHQILGATFSAEVSNDGLVVKENVFAIPYDYFTIQPNDVICFMEAIQKYAEDKGYIDVKLQSIEIVNFKKIFLDKIRKVLHDVFFEVVIVQDGKEIKHLYLAKNELEVIKSYQLCSDDIVRPFKYTVLLPLNYTESYRKNIAELYAHI